MQFLELHPHPVLAPFVQLIWCAEFDSAAQFGPPERIAPDGIVELVFHYRGRMAISRHASGVSPAPRSAVVCQTTQPIDIYPSGSVGLISVRFRPWGALHFMDMPVAALADSVLPAEAVWGRALVDLDARLASAARATDRVSLLENFLIDQLVRHHKTNVETVIREIWRHRGAVRVPDLSRQLGVSDRTLHRVLNRAVGMSPKAYTGLTRFLNACGRLRARNWHSLADVAAERGYYDQPHFNGQFRKYAGMAPMEFINTTSFSFLPIE